MASPEGVKPSIIEIRTFKLRNTVDNMPQRTNDLLAKSLPAGPVGVFGSLIAEDSPFTMIVTGYPSIAAFESARETAFDKGLEYTRMEVTLLRGFRTMPVIEVPPAKRGGSRVFELRTYESNNMSTLARKIKMFDDGEIGLFRKIGMIPIFFGETIAGRNMPNLTYMLAYDDLAAREKLWSTFGSHPEWQKMRSQSGLSDGEIVSNISNSMLRPLPSSQIK